MTTSAIARHGCEVAGRVESVEDYLDEMQELVRNRQILDVEMTCEAVAAGWNLYGGFPKLRRQKPVPIREIECLSHL